ncbi:MAG: hypothetical protein FVQ85_15570 [Planctomycetes bacterium]|nr:hypothetical protein [Planctomycetota bacterium]
MRKLSIITTLILLSISISSYATDVGGIISSDTTWTLAESPYNLVSNVQIGDGITLTIEPGVEVFGDHLWIEVWGTLDATGTASSKIVLDDMFIWAKDSTGIININFSEIDTVKIRTYGDTLILKDSYVRNYYDGSQGIHISNGSSVSYIERNIFVNTVDIDVASTNTYIHNNVFYEQINGEAIISGNVNPSVKYNTFLTTDKIAVKLQDSGSMTATYNYWNTTDSNIIDNMIWDRNDDLNISNYISYMPFLIDPDPNTPVYSPLGTWTELNMPGIDNVSLLGTGSNMIVGHHGSNPYHGLVYDMTTGSYNTLDKPGAGALGTEIRDIDSNNLIGSYYDSRWHGFIYNLIEQSWTTIDVPGNSSMQPYGIDGENVVGYYFDGSRWHGFIYSMLTEIYTTLDKPGAQQMYPVGISGDKIVGRYHDGSFHGFIYDMTAQTWTTLDALGSSETIVKGIDGDNIVGYYNGGRSFLYNTTTQTWSSIYTEEGSDNIFPQNIGGDNIIFNIGQYGSFYTIAGPPPVVPTCFAPVEGDANGDCKVDFFDFAIMLSNWLVCNLQPPSACW